MAKDNIAWFRDDADGTQLEIYAHRVGTQWNFHCRPGRKHGRNWEWQPLVEPTLDDWLEVLDGVRRRVQRRQYLPADVTAIETEVRKRFPKAEL
ncbi:MAG: hypothetical protein EPO68_09195 [Planctomycetota bacterium]|nr:MAG: hypothetical protein EPO68_09195 [Planctomycetota bacterium]